METIWSNNTGALEDLRLILASSSGVRRKDRGCSEGSLGSCHPCSTSNWAKGWGALFCALTVWPYGGGLSAKPQGSQTVLGFFCEGASLSVHPSPGIQPRDRGPLQGHNLACASLFLQSHTPTIALSAQLPSGCLDSWYPVTYDIKFFLAGGALWPLISKPKICCWTCSWAIHSGAPSKKTWHCRWGTGISDMLLSLPIVQPEPLSLRTQISGYISFKKNKRVWLLFNFIILLKR